MANHTFLESLCDIECNKIKNQRGYGFSIRVSETPKIIFKKLTKNPFAFQKNLPWHYQIHQNYFTSTTSPLGKITCLSTFYTQNLSKSTAYVGTVQPQKLAKVHNGISYHILYYPYKIKTGSFTIFCAGKKT